MILLSHATGNENVRQAARALAEADLLQEFWTTISWDPEHAVNQLLPKRLRQLLGRRSFPPSVRSRTRTTSMREFFRLAAGSMGLSSFATRESDPFNIDRVMRALDRKVAQRLPSLPKCKAVYAYEDGALETFRAARVTGVQRIYDLPIGYWRVAQKIYSEEREREPEWAETLTGTRDSEDKLARKDEEVRLANRVVVASTFTRQTLSEAALTVPVEVVSYGAPATVDQTAPVTSSETLRVIYVGSLGQRKGLSYLLKAVESMGSRVQLTLIGRKTASQCRPLDAAVRRHRWIPSLPHEAVLREMRGHHVLVLPSLFEGFGLVILEAMAEGLVVITTPHTAGPDVITEGIDGFIVPIRSAEAIAEKLDLLAVDRTRLSAMKVEAQRKAASRGWENYRQSLVQMAREVMLLEHS